MYKIMNEKNVSQQQTTTTVLQASDSGHAHINKMFRS